MDTEADLLARIADGDDAARGVLADWWIEHGDEARGRFVQCQLQGATAAADALLDEHGERWLAAVADYPREQLIFERGFLRDPLVMSSENDRALFRLSPLGLREGTPYLDNDIVRVATALTFTITKVHRKVLVVYATADLGLLWDEMFVHPDPSGTTDTLGYAVHPGGPALVLPWGGLSVSMLRQRPLGAAVAAAIACAVCDRLAGPHDLGAPHRRINPLNVFVADNGAITLLNLNRLGSRRALSRHEFYDYMAPEQARGLPLDPRTDVFSCAMLCASLVTGVHPIRDAANDFDRLLAVRDCNFVLPALPDDVARVLRVALARAPEQRYATCGELAAALRACRSIELGPHVIAAALSSWTRAPRPS